MIHRNKHKSNEARKSLLSESNSGGYTSTDSYYNSNSNNNNNDAISLSGSEFLNEGSYDTSRTVPLKRSPLKPSDEALIEVMNNSNHSNSKSDAREHALQIARQKLREKNSRSASSSSGWGAGNWTANFDASISHSGGINTPGKNRISQLASMFTSATSSRAVAVVKKQEDTSEKAKSNKIKQTDTSSSSYPTKKSASNRPLFPATSVRPKSTVNNTNTNTTGHVQSHVGVVSQRVSSPSKQSQAQSQASPQVQVQHKKVYNNTRNHHLNLNTSNHSTHSRMSSTTTTSSNHSGLNLKPSSSGKQNRATITWAAEHEEAEVQRWINANSDEEEEDANSLSSEESSHSYSSESGYSETTDDNDDDNDNEMEEDDNNEYLQHDASAGAFPRVVSRERSNIGGSGGHNRSSSLPQQQQQHKVLDPNDIVFMATSDGVGGHARSKSLSHLVSSPLVHQQHQHQHQQRASSSAMNSFARGSIKSRTSPAPKRKSVKNILNLFDPKPPSNINMGNGNKAGGIIGSVQSKDPWDDVETSTVASSQNAQLSDNSSDVVVNNHHNLDMFPDTPTSGSSFRNDPFARGKVNPESLIDTGASMERVRRSRNDLKGGGNSNNNANQHDRSKEGIFRRGSSQSIRQSGKGKVPSRSPSQSHHMPTENSMMRNESLSAPFRHPHGSTMMQGNNQFLTKGEVPNLMDDEMTSTSIGTHRLSPEGTHRSSPVSPQPSSLYLSDIESGSFDRVDSDLFDFHEPERDNNNDGFAGSPRGTAYVSRNDKQHAEGSPLPRRNSFLVDAAKNSQAAMLLASGATDQSSRDNANFAKFPQDLNTSADQYTESNFSGTLIGEEVIDSIDTVPIERIALSSGTSESVASASRSYYSDSDSSYFSDDYGLDKYYVEPKMMTKLVRKYRRLCTPKDEDATKSFALFETRSRIMESDIERGLKRKGWTFPVDDIVMTPSNMACMRIRDAVIVAKAWRDGASPSDVTTAWTLGRRRTHTYFVKRGHGRRATYEKVGWLDDSDLMQKRSFCLGAKKSLSGFEMFTISDCQSLLLKLTNERRVTLGKELHDATERQIFAEERMKKEAEEGFSAFADDDDPMTDAEMAYLSAMEDVKSLSRALVIAEKAFQLVRERIERLVSKYETMLVKLETDTYDSESIESDTMMDYDTDGRHLQSYSQSFDIDQEKKMLSNRAKQAELQAEVAAREVLLAKEEAKRLKFEKQRELEALQKRLDELEKKSMLEKERSAKLVSEYERKLEDGRNLSLSMSQTNGSPPSSVSGFRDRDTSDARSYLESAVSERDEAKIAACERVKAKFRERQGRHSNKKRNAHSNTAAGNDESKNRGQRLYNDINFYERSLKAVK